MSHDYYVYIVGNQRPILYIGVTNNLITRVHQHKQEQIEGFTKKYKLKSLLYYEIHRDISQAIKREKQIKKWKREWKLNLIRKHNPTFQDLYQQLSQ